MTTHIYALLDEFSSVRYVGKTGKKIGKRLLRHLSIARSGGLGHKNNWIRSMLKMGFTPEVRLLESVPGNGSNEERKWIAFFRSESASLCNCTDGGEGASGLKFSQEHRAKISRALTGIKRSEATKMLIRKARSVQQEPVHACHHTEETKSKIRKALSPKEVRKKIGDANRGRKKSAAEIQRWRMSISVFWSNPENHKKQSERIKGKKASAETKAILSTVQRKRRLQERMVKYAAVK